MSDSTIETPVTLCVLLWAISGQAAALAAYEDRVLDLVTDHGGRVLQRGTVSGAADGAPTEVQFLEFDSAADMDSYMKDPRRTALAAERDAAIARTDVHRISPR
jgi:uncharacterized protein (DUF1330 family)